MPSIAEYGKECDVQQSLRMLAPFSPELPSPVYWSQSVLHYPLRCSRVSALTCSSTFLSTQYYKTFELSRGYSQGKTGDGVSTSRRRHGVENAIVKIWVFLTERFPLGEVIGHRVPLPSSPGCEGELA